MIGYATVGTNDLETATRFYDQVLTLLGAQRVYESDRSVYYGQQGLEFGVLKPFDGQPAAVGNGHMVALQAPTRAAVDAVHALVLRLGGSDEGAPGLRGDDPDGFYGAYWRDPEGNKLCVFRMGPAA